MQKPLYIYGAGGVGKMALQIVRDINRHEQTWDVIAILEDNPELHGTSVSGIKVAGGLEVLQKADQPYCTIGFSKPALKKKLAEKLKSEVQDIIFPKLIHPMSWISDEVELGEGSVVYPGVCIDTNVQIGTHATINKNATFGHDSVYGDYLTVSPGVNLGGFLTVGEGTEFGIGCSTIQSLNIGPWTRVGAGAAVISNTEGNCTVVGVPAKRLG